MRALLKIEDKGRAADGRRLALRAVIIQLFISWFLFVILAALELAAGHNIKIMSLSAMLSSALLILVLWGISRNKIWIGILYGLYCLFVIFGSLNFSQRGIFSAIGTITDAILSFVALSGIAIWIRHREKRQE